MVNAFWLDRDLERAATWLVDRHVTSSVFECSMVLTTAVQRNGYPESDALYVTHPDHPLIRRAARSLTNWHSPVVHRRGSRGVALSLGSRLDGLPRLLGDRSITRRRWGSRPRVASRGPRGSAAGDGRVDGRRLRRGIGTTTRTRSASCSSVERAVDAGLDPGIHGRRDGVTPAPRSHHAGWTVCERLVRHEGRETDRCRRGRSDRVRLPALQSETGSILARLRREAR